MGKLSEEAQNLYNDAIRAGLPIPWDLIYGGTDPDGGVSKAEFVADGGKGEEFDKWDSNHDGKLDAGERAAAALAGMTDEQRAAALAGMSDADKAAALAAMSPEERAAAMAGMSDADKAAALAAMSPEERAAAMAGMSDVDRAAAMAGMSAADKAAALAAMTPEERAAALAAMSPFDRAMAAAGGEDPYIAWARNHNYDACPKCHRFGESVLYHNHTNVREKIVR